MKKSKIILLFKILLIILVLIRCIFSFIFSKEKNIPSENIFIGEILNIKVSNNKLTIKLKSKEKILVNYYTYNNDYSYLKVGDIIKVEGRIEYPKQNTNFNLFNYKNYLLSEKIYFICNASKITFIRNTNNILIKIKGFLTSYINKFKSKDYLNTFILGDNNLLDDDIKETFRNNGISHLFAVSGMHIALISSILIFILNSFIKNKNFCYLLTIIFLLFYSFITNFSPSILRAFLLFLFIYINNKYNLKFKTIEIIIFILCILLLYNPFYIYNIGFIFTFLISIGLILFSKKINNFKNYFTKLFITSLIAFLLSIPILINNFFEINLLTPFINLIFVPIISIIIFPFSLITLFIPILDNIFYNVLNIMENISILINNFFNLTIILKKMDVFTIFLYYLIMYLTLNKFLLKKYVYILFILIFIFLYSNINYLNSNTTITMIDVGQGDSILIQLPYNKGNILLDTGGIVNYNSINYSIANKTTIPYIKSMGIKKLDYLILSHGDFDHMGEAINIVNNFKVNKVIFNCGEFNDLEKQLIKVLNNKNIPYYSCINKINISNNELYFLNTEQYDNENDNSNIIYTKLNNYSFLFMGDAGSNVEKNLLQKYNLNNIDVLKVGHHGSKTSSSKLFINKINPKYSLISVGKNNRYSHPNKETLNNLESSKIYRTDLNGSILFKIKNGKLKIETCL